MKEKIDLKLIKKYGVFVAMGSVALILFYIILKPDSKEDKVVETSGGLNTSIPTAQQNKLSDNKMEIYYAEEEKNRKDRRAKSDAFYSNLSNLTDGSFNDSKEEYKKAPDSINNRLDELLAKMEKEKPKTPVRSVGQSTYNNRSNNVYTAPPAPARDPFAGISMSDWEKNQESDFFGSNRVSENRDANKGKEVLHTDPVIYAVIQGDQIIRNQQRVTMRLSKDAIINNQIYKKNTMFYAKAIIQINRLNLRITNIAHNQVSLDVYDGQDGGKGLYVETPNLIASMGTGMQEDVISDADVSGVPLGNTIKGIFTKKQREDKIQLLNNTKLILKP